MLQAWLARAPGLAAGQVRAGVSFIGPADGATCWCCGLEPSRWAAGDSPTRGCCGPHAQCSHLLGQDSSSTLSWGGRDLMDGQILGQLHPLAEQVEGARATPCWSPRTLLCLRPSFPSMGSREVRLASFYDWPLTAMVRPELLATAGFFYSSQQDMVRCFCCCGGLWNWEQGDDPWTEHARWFPRCEFLLRTKGRDFVCGVQESCCHPPGSWDQWEELEDAAPATLSAPVSPGPELPTPRRQAHSEGAREPDGAWGFPSPGTGNLEEQLQRLQEERTCRVCLDRAVCVVFVPCGHLACVQCAASLQLCPICRAPIQSCVRTFLS
uniref:RING-type E3 ubiquitin transferase n=1 Tax=Molossus molossus TaxID=27622 RepID=A0A7J8HFD8_MOLMO|nr:baculoviral IAP repeat containing 7 [Molossus molossus]